MKRCVLVQVNNRYGDNVYLPYSVGLLWAYAATQPVAADWELGGFVYLKEPIERALDRIDAEPDLIGLSCYIWNWRWSLAFARCAKRRWPRCAILVGGVQITGSELAEHPSLDYAIVGEGEGAFVALLAELAKPEPELARVGGLWWRDRDGAVHQNTERCFAPLEDLRSPYLDGTFAPVLGDGWKWQGLQETNRGCPYSCSFCAWGAAALDKLRKLPMERVLAELDWFSEHQVGYVENCDANFGILPRDQEIIDRMIELKARTGYPERFRAAWAKNSNDKVYQMARALHRANMLKAVTLSVQSLDEEVLGLVRRKNIRYENLSALIARYQSEAIPTYSELILGLPGETRKTFEQGIDRLLQIGQHDSLFIYPCMILPNTEMAHPDYIAQHEIETRPVQAMLLHGIPEPGAVPEVQDIVVATSTMPYSEWRWCFRYAWAIQALHGCGATQLVARELCGGRGIAYAAFYVELLQVASRKPNSVLGRELVRFEALVDRALSGGSWDLIDPRFGPVSWPPEEFAFLQIVLDADRFYAELGEALAELGWVDYAPAIERQRRALIRPAPGQEASWARDAVWYGRKGSGARLRLRRDDGDDDQHSLADAQA